MGFSITCEGADLLKSLRINEDSVLGRRYPLYIIALATEVDDNAIRWLSENGRALDSVTGSFIAFLIFYNSARFHASATHGQPFHASTTRGQRIVDLEGTEAVFRYRLPSIEVPPSALQGAWNLRQYVAGKMQFPDEAFVTSMTYESDALSRELGVMPNELPCLVLIDDPLGSEVYILPMEQQSDSDLFSILRRIIGDFYADKAHKEYFDLIRQWDEQQKLLFRLQRQKTFQLDDHFGKESYSDARESLRSYLASPQDQHKLTDKGEAALKALTLELFDRAKGCRRAISVAHDLEKGMIRFDGKVRKSIYQNFLKKFFDSESKQRWCSGSGPSEEEAKEIIQSAVAPGSQARLLLEQDMISLQSAIQLAQEELDSARNTVEENINKIIKQLDDMDRPKIGPALSKYKWIQRKQIASTWVKRAAGTAEKGASALLKILELGTKLQ